ncbi:MAG TPA: ATP-dependent helicase [Patescibacteria group bacterium]|nr:ATP-dependent helicase [Patescibacteria group bacterium]
MPAQDFTKELNQEQLAVVLQGNGPCLVLAGAGSGKTRVITYRVAYLLANGVRPDEILLVTFTNKAAGEMISRVQKITGHTERLPWAGTFHHVANKILRQYAPLLGYKNNFTILDADDSEALLKLCIKEYKDETMGKRFPSARVLKNIYSYARNAETTVDQVLDLRHPDWYVYAEKIKDIWSAYERRKKEANAMDFDDLLFNFLLLLNQEKVLAKFAEQFKYILVDEYQDTNKLQASIILKLALKHKNLLVVGDDAQSIYSFRAADIQNILRFEDVYPEAKIFKLETNYRSHQKILNLANDVIANNFKQLKKNLRTALTETPGLGKPELYPQMDEAEEAEFVVREVKHLKEKGVRSSEIAVLFRAASHAHRLEMELVKANISYDFRGGLRFFERAHVKDVLSYLRILTNISDTAAWMRVLLHEEGIGPTGANKIASSVKQMVDAREILEAEVVGMSEKAKVGWNNFVSIFKSLLNAGETPDKLIAALIESPYRDYLEAEFIDADERMEDLEEMMGFAGQYATVEDFLAEATLQESFILQKDRTTDTKDKVILSTIHQAKGLEWEAVLIINLTNGAFPNERALKENGGLEEERRLFYVALTRAKKYLYLTYPMEQKNWGGTAGPSLFLDEIDRDLIEDHSLLGGDNYTVLNDDDVTYEAEDRPIRIKPGSLLRDIDDL